MAIKKYIAMTLISLCLPSLSMNDNDREYLNFKLGGQIRQGNIPKIDKLLQQGADINPVGESLPPLHTAIMYKKPDIVAHLLSAGAHVNLLNMLGATPLHFAINVNNQDIVKQLINAGTDALIKDSEGKTALDLAQSPLRAEATSEERQNRTEIVRLLREHLVKSTTRLLGYARNDKGEPLKPIPQDIMTVIIGYAYGLPQP
ncbi:ankyrin repeat domain-containing protein [Candidatus Dependentiae bacterium]|nr:ankyrin repeat domain-containing protein [Candidatus Dependentiae bacterium]